MLRAILLSVSTIIALTGYIPYIIDIFKGKTKPHIFTWVIPIPLGLIAFFAALSDGGGLGAYVNLFSALTSVFIALLALKFSKDISITKFDWICFALAGLSILAWRITDNALYAVIIISLVELLAFAPTFRKSYGLPHSETLSSWYLAATKHLLAIFALSNITLTTSLYPATNFVMVSVFIVMIYKRRSKLKDPALPPL